MVPPVPLNSSVAPMSSGATWCTERSKNERRRQGGEGMTQTTQSTHACESEHRAATYTPVHSRESGNPARTRRWTPASAGVSGRGGDRPAQNFLLGQWNVALDYLCKVYIPMTLPPRYRGAFDQRLNTRGGERCRGMTLHRRCDARAPRSKPRLSQRARPARRGPVMAGRPCSRHRSAASSALAWLRWDVTQRFRPHVAGTTTGEGAEQAD